jgi:REP element-mobilizing transposase RayT
MREYVWNLRSGRSFRRIRRALAAAKGRFGLRIIEFCVLGNHVHLLVEADDDVALSRGIQGLAIRIAKALNAMMSRAGKVFADHFHSRLLRSPTELVRAIRYVLTNVEHHYGASGPDDYTSSSLSSSDRESLLSRGVSWLLRVGIFRVNLAASG